jgi:hypothetical protein
MTLEKQVISEWEIQQRHIIKENQTEILELKNSINEIRHISIDRKPYQIEEVLNFKTCLLGLAVWLKRGSGGVVQEI